MLVLKLKIPIVCLVAETVAVLKANGMGPIFLLGHSQGGTLVLRAAFHYYCQVDAICTINSFMAIPEEHNTVRKLQTHP